MPGESQATKPGCAWRQPRAAGPRISRPEFLLDAQLFLNQLQWHAFGFRHHRFHPDQLQHHHAGEERENVPGREMRDHLWEESREQRGEYPMRETAQRLAFRTMPVGKYLRDENPDNRSLTNRVGGDEGEDAYRHNGVMIGKKSPGHKAERGNISERADVEQRAAAETIDQPES